MNKEDFEYIHNLEGQVARALQGVSDRLDGLEKRIDRAEHDITYATTRREAPAQPCPTGCVHLWNGTLRGRRCIYCGVEELIPPLTEQSKAVYTEEIPSPQPEPKHLHHCYDNMGKGGSCICPKPEPKEEMITDNQKCSFCGRVSECRGNPKRFQLCFYCASIQDMVHQMVESIKKNDGN